MNKRKNSIAKTEKIVKFMRAFEECTECLTSNKPFPKPLGYYRAKIYYKLDQSCINSNSPMNSSSAINSQFNYESSIYLFDCPVDDQTTYDAVINNFEYLNSDRVLDKHSIDYLVSNSVIRINNVGKWILITKIKVFNMDEIDSKKSKSVTLKRPVWLLKHKFNSNEQPIKLIEISDLKSEKQSNNSNKDWIHYVENCYSLKVDHSELDQKFKPNYELMKQVTELPKNWSSDLDEELVEMIKDSVNTDISGSIRNFIKSITLSTQRTSFDTDYLISLDRRTYWESDAYSSSYNVNSIRLFLKPNIVIKQLYIVVNKSHRLFMPKDVSVHGGNNPEDIQQLNKIVVKSGLKVDDGDVLILENCSKAYNYLEIRIESCQRNVTNCRIFGLKLFPKTEEDDPIPSEIFSYSKLERNFPRLSNFKPIFLYRRAELLLRFVKLFDLCMEAILPSWTYGEYFDKLVSSVKKILVLSTKRIFLLEKIFNSVPVSVCFLPLVYIDRPLAFAYRGKTNLDPNYQNTIFMQIYNNLAKSSSFRWEKSVDQWWECKFIGEGIIDQGGGFRDSLSDISEELCPNEMDTLVPLPFFIRSPNQLQSDLNTFRDMFVANPSCKLFEEFEFIGKLMGACVRSNETLALFMASFFWKKISGEKISWKNDFVTVDHAQVQLLDTIEKMDKSEYESKYADEITWSCTLSDGTLVMLKPDGNQISVKYEQRLEYCEMVKKVRMSESDKQIEAIKRGLQSVLSKHFFCIFTWSEFEFSICGAANISVEDLKMSIDYDEDISPDDNTVKYFWEAISNFTNEERSKFVRFVTGRKRLPVKIFFFSSDQPATSFPDSSTCNCSIYFPSYPNAQVAEEKLRYAIYNCVAIDTDCSSYETL